MPEPRTAKLVIDQAIRENRGASILCYALVILFTVTGVAVLIGGALAREGLVSLAGSVASILFWPALNQARQIRELNLSIRLLEIRYPARRMPARPPMRCVSFFCNDSRQRSNNESVQAETHV